MRDTVNQSIRRTPATTAATATSADLSLGSDCSHSVPNSWLMILVKERLLELGSKRIAKKGMPLSRQHNKTTLNSALESDSKLQ